MIVKHDLSQKMSDIDNRQQEGTNPAEEIDLDTQTVDTDIDIDNDFNPDEDLTAEELKKKDEIIRQLTARAKKSELELKTLRSKETPKITNGLSPDEIDIKILKAKGTTDDEIKYLQKIAAVNGTTVFEAEQDELFTAYKAKQDESKKSEKARLGASRGGGTVKKEENFTSQGLSGEKHKELWLKSRGR